MNNLFVYGSLKSKKVQLELFGKELNTRNSIFLFIFPFVEYSVLQ